MSCGRSQAGIFAWARTGKSTLARFVSIGTTRCCSVQGSRWRMTPKALDMLHYLASRPDRLVTKQELLSALWPDGWVGDASIKVCVSEIRRTLRDDAERPQYIQTVFRGGYRFIAPIVDAEHGQGAILSPPPVLRGRVREGVRASRRIVLHNPLPSPPPEYRGREKRVIDARVAPSVVGTNSPHCTMPLNPPARAMAV